MTDTSRIKLGNYEVTGWKSAVVFLTIWLMPGIVGYLLGRLH